MAIEADQLYTVAELAAMLRCSIENVYNLLSSGQLARTSIGSGKKGFRIRGKDISEFLDSRREGGPKPNGTLKYLKLRS